MIRSVSFDVAIIGAGPAGVAAACTASDSGMNTALIDDNAGPGGQIWRGESASSRDVEASRWLGRLTRSSVRHLPQTRVFDVPERGVLIAESADGGAIEIACRKLVIATGARELYLPFPGWTLPNVMGAGGLQALAKSGMPVQGSRIVIAGTGPLLLAVAAYLLGRGAVIRAVVEQAPLGELVRFGLGLGRQPAKLLQAMRLRTELAGVRCLYGSWPVAAHGETQVRSVSLTDGKRTWQEECDYLACGFGLVPNVELPLALGCRLSGGFVDVDEWQQTSATDVYCAGEPTGIGGVNLALVEGEIAGHVCADKRENAREKFGARKRLRDFQSRLESTFRLRSELKQIADDNTIVCRCEDVTLGRIRSHASWRTAKLQTRCGMGPCQGRICGPALKVLLGWTHESVRPPIVPVSLACLTTPRKRAAQGES